MVTVAARERVIATVLARVGNAFDGGRYLVRRAPWQILEGGRKAFTGVIEFPDAEAAQRWYDSPAF